MNLAERLLSRAPNYIRAYGLVRGIKLLYEIEGSNWPSRSCKEDEIVVEALQGPVLLRRQQSDRSIFWQCVVRRQYDFFGFPQSERLRAAYSAAVSAGIRPLIIDGGANIGLATRFLAPSFPKALFVAVEPDAENAELLRRNLAPLGDRVRVLNGALWSQPAHLRIANPDAGSAAFRVEALAEPTTSSVRAYSIGEVCALAEVEAPFIVKLDIEGSQANLFIAATEWVAKTNLIMLELDDWLMPWQGTSRAFFACLSRYPFDYLLGGETIFCFRDFDCGRQTSLG